MDLYQLYSLFSFLINIGMLYFSAGKQLNLGGREGKKISLLIMRIWVGSTTQTLYIIFKSAKIWSIKDAYVNFFSSCFFWVALDVFGGDYLIHCFCALTFCIWHYWNFLNQQIFFLQHLRLSASHVTSLTSIMIFITFKWFTLSSILPLIF